jgi:aryl-alcohol dehydrogenase-like predicted oxidoreductase
MKNKNIPNTNLTVSPICLGTMTFGTPVGEADAINIVHYALDHGVNFIDTANMYEGYSRVIGSAGGVAEEILGKALKGRRGRAVVATKVGMKVGPDPEDEGTSPAAIRKQLDKSLKKMAMDCVDIYYLHKPDPSSPLEDILGALNDAIRQGKIKHYGLSNYSAEQTAKLLEIADKNNLPRPVIHQPPYSLLKRDIEKDLLPLCEKQQIAVAPYQVLQGGVLTGKYQRGQKVPDHSRGSEKPNWLPELNDAFFDRLEQIENEAKAKKQTLMQYAILETLALPPVASVVLGVKSPDQVQALVNVFST